MRDADALDELCTALAHYRSGKTSASELADDVAEIVEATGRRSGARRMIGIAPLPHDPPQRRA